MQYVQRRRQSFAEDGSLPTQRYIPNLSAFFFSDLAFLLKASLEDFWGRSCIHPLDDVRG